MVLVWVITPTSVHQALGSDESRRQLSNFRGIASYCSVVSLYIAPRYRSILLRGIAPYCSVIPFHSFYAYRGAKGNKLPLIVFNKWLITKNNIIHIALHFNYNLHSCSCECWQCLYTCSNVLPPRAFTLMTVPHKSGMFNLHWRSYCNKV